MFIDESQIQDVLTATQKPDTQAVKDILEHAREMKGISASEVALLANVEDPELLHQIFETARTVKEEIYGKRLVLFAPLYISNLCGNECLYCAFRARNTGIHRRALSQQEIAAETRTLIDQGHKRVLLVAGESYPREGFQYVLDSIATIYATRHNHGEIRRVNVNVAPLRIEEFQQLKAAQIGTYQLFQETYHRETYAKVHVSGRKQDYDWRITAIDRAMQAGIDDVGIGVLFGLADWRFEILALMQHIQHLEKTFGVGPHTISVPRLEPASGTELASHPPQPVTDEDFRKIIAILRLAVPYTGIILSTRESPEMRGESYALGVSQISAGSRTNPGGYSDAEDYDASQFALGDHRSLDEVIRSIAGLGYIPSFCTGCYRMGRTGADFMDLAKPGDIKMHCEPNALSTYQEYLNDYATPETRTAGETLIDNVIAGMHPQAASRARTLVDKVRAGGHDIYC
jgi:2-iminoacetate synthase